MTYETTPDIVVRQDVVDAFEAAFKVVSPKDIKDPISLEGHLGMETDFDNIPEIQKAIRLSNEWQKNQEEWLYSGSRLVTEQNKAQFEFDKYTIYWDAGFNEGVDYLDVLANDWLDQDEYTARQNGWDEFADWIQEVRKAINNRISELR